MTGYSPEALATYSAELRWRLTLRQQNNDRIGELQSILTPVSPLDALRKELRERGLGG